MLPSVAEYYDLGLQKQVVGLSPGWLRYPAGPESAAFNWATGQLDQAWIRHPGFGASTTLEMQRSLQMLADKGPATIDDFASLAEAAGSKIIVTVNALTDTPASAGALAQYVRDHNLPVVAWELANEAYGFMDGPFFASATGYADKMRPYRDAIKAVDPNAIVTIFFNDLQASATWNSQLAKYPDQYWDAISYHHYSPNSYAMGGSGLLPDDLIKMDTADLAGQTTNAVRTLLSMNRPGTKVIITQYGAASPPGAFREVYAAEFAMRLSTIQQVLYVGRGGSSRR